MIKNVVLVSGPSGCDRDAYIKEAIGTRDDTNYYQVFDYMKFVAAVDGSALSETNIDDPNKEPHIKWRTEAFDLIAEEIESSNKTNHIISTTCIFDYPSGVIEEGITGELFNVIKPNTVIVFIDDLIAIKKRLKNDDRWKRIFRESGGEASLSILAHWRQAATDLLEKLANTYKKLHCDSQTGFVENFFIFAKQHPKETFLSLIFETKTKYQIYLSYPITDAEDNGDFEGLKRVMSDYFVVFDPYTIKEWQIVDKYDDAIEGRLSQIEFEDIIIQTSEIEFCHSSH
jgi:adenylate kinase